MLTLGASRSFLFVPASRPERFAKALASPADRVIIDLEDAVAPADKIHARAALMEALHGFDAAQLARTLVRINPAGTEWHGADLNALTPWWERGLGGVAVPKAESAPALQAIAAALGPQAVLVALVETLAGLDALSQIAVVPAVRRLAFGHIDFQLDLGMRCTPDEPELAPVRFQFVAASRRAGLAAPIDGVTVAVADEALVRRDAARAGAMGFGAKLCIHPAQVGVVNGSFSPSAEEIAWAERVLQAVQHGGGEAVQVDGKMVDAPVIQLARQTLARVVAVDR